MLTSVATNFLSLAQLCTPEVTLINYPRVKAILVLDQRFLANELSMLGTIYHVTLLTSQVSMHSEVVLYVWTSVITSCVTDNFYTFYRAMHFSAKRGIEIAYRLSVRP